MSKKFFVSSLNELAQEYLFDGLVLRRVIQTKNIEIVEYIYKPGAYFPEHSHREEQVTIVDSGKILFYVDGREQELKEGDICYIPPFQRHSARVLGEEDVRTINIFHPSRKTRP